MGSFTQQRDLSIYWRNKASDLNGAAAAVYHAIENNTGFPRQDFGLSSGYSFECACPLVFRMLAGMALEALLKAIVVEKGRDPKQTHNLNQLARDAGVVFSNEEQKLLQIMSESIIWDGRYPVPKQERHWDSLNELKRETFIGKEIPGSGTLIARSPSRKLDWQSYQSIWLTANNEMLRIASWVSC